MLKCSCWGTFIPSGAILSWACSAVELCLIRTSKTLHCLKPSLFVWGFAFIETYFCFGLVFGFGFLIFNNPDWPRSHWVLGKRFWFLETSWLGTFDPLPCFLSAGITGHISRLGFCYVGVARCYTTELLFHSQKLEPLNAVWRPAKWVVWLVFVQELLDLVDFKYLVSVSAHRPIYHKVFAPCICTTPISTPFLNHVLQQWMARLEAALTSSPFIFRYVLGDDGFLCPPAHWTEDASDWSGDMEEWAWPGEGLGRGGKLLESMSESRRDLHEGPSIFRSKPLL